MASDLLDMSFELTKGYLNQNQLTKDELPDLIRSIHQTLSDLRNTGSPTTIDAAPTAITAAPVAALPASSATALPAPASAAKTARSEEHTSELQSLMRISYAVFCLK